MDGLALLLFVGLFVMPALAACINAIQKNRDPAKWAAMQEAEQRAKAAKDARKAQALGLGVNLFRLFMK